MRAVERAWISFFWVCVGGHWQLFWRNSVTAHDLQLFVAINRAVMDLPELDLVTMSDADRDRHPPKKLA